MSKEDLRSEKTVCSECNKDLSGKPIVRINASVISPDKHIEILADTICLSCAKGIF